MVSPRGAGALGPETEANRLENQPVTFKGRSSQGQHRIPVCLQAHSSQTARLKTATLLDSSLFPATNI